MTSNQQILEIKERVAKLPNFKSRCFVCQTYIAKRGFTFHHLWYLVNDVVRKDYPDNETGTLQYYEHLEIKIYQNPKRFLYLCNIHHQAITRLLRWKGQNRQRLIQAVRMSP